MNDGWKKKPVAAIPKNGSVYPEILKQYAETITEPSIHSIENI